jgi:exopolysaccharide production protein ExoZ
VQVKQAYYPGMDLLRFVSASMVLFFYLGWRGSVAPTSQQNLLEGDDYYAFILELLGYPGFVGVEIFFVISGFVIASSAVGKDAWVFLKNRAYRLYPAVFLCATLTAILLFHLGIPNAAARYVRSMTLVPWGSKVDSQYWTLGTEMVFYAIVFFTICVFRGPKLPWIAFLLGVGSVIFTVLLQVTADVAPGLHHFMESFTKGPRRAMPFYYGEFFAIGIYIYLWGRGLIDRLGFVVLGLCVAAGMLHVVQVHSVYAGQAVYGTLPLDQLAIVPVILFLAGCGVVLWSALSNVDVGPRAGRVIRSLGLMTYPLYLLHLTIGAWMIRQLIDAGWSSVPAFSAVLVVLVFASWLAAEYCEPAIRRLMRRTVEGVEGAVRKAIA